MFNVNDIVTGKLNNGYAVTGPDCLLKVTTTFDETFMGEMIAHKSKKYASFIGDVYEELKYDEFVIANQDTIDDIKGIKKAKPKAATITLGALKVAFYDTGMIESNFNPEHMMRPESDPNRVDVFEAIRALYDKTQRSIFDFKNVDLSVFDDILSEKVRVKALDDLIKFFIEFNFEPNFRFVNTLGIMLQESLDDGRNYIKNYFKLTNSPYVTAVIDKMKSPEFDAILSSLSLCNPANVINKRLKVYYGSQGTGKTTMAMEETEGRCIVCNNSILPQDLLEDFAFSDGKPGFQKSMFRKCAEEGTTVVLDEGNLLPFETLRFLQGILDGKKEFTYKGETIHIKDGFGIIITMNLMVNGMAFGLPEPLIDRCADIQEYKLSGKQLLNALL